MRLVPLTTVQKLLTPENSRIPEFDTWEGIFDVRWVKPLIMGLRKGAGGVLAIVACPCHLPLYLILFGLLGFGGAALTGLLFPALTIGFIGGLAILLWPDSRKLSVSTTNCCDTDASPANLSQSEG